MQLLFLHSQAAASRNNTTGTKSPSDSKTRNNSALAQEDEIQFLRGADSKPALHRQESAQTTKCLYVHGGCDAAEPGCSSGGEEGARLSLPLPQPSATLSSLPFISILPCLTWAGGERCDIWGQQRVTRGALPEEPPRFLLHRAGAGDTQFPSSHLGPFPL